MKNLIGALTCAIAVFFVSPSVLADKYVAVKLKDKILVSNGKWNYVVDPTDLAPIVKKEGFAVIKIYSTGVFVQMNKTGELLVRNSRVKNVPYFVLAPMKSLEPDSKINYKIAIMVPKFSNSMIYPSDFCTNCAVPTKVEKSVEQVTHMAVLASESPKTEEKPVVQ